MVKNIYFKLDNLYKTLVKIKLDESEIRKKTFNNRETSTFKYEIKEQFFAKDFDIQKILIQRKNSEVFDMKIKNYCLNNKKNIDSLLLLRCRVSHAILANIKSIWYENNTNVTLMDLLSIFLEDPGSRYLSFKKKKGKEKREFDYMLIEELYKIFSIKKARIHPFSLNVIHSYESKNNSSISYWTRFLINRDPEIAAILRPHGQRVITDWALIYDTSITKMMSSWYKYGSKDIFYSFQKDINFEKFKIEKTIESIFKNYQFYYPKAIEIYRRINRRDTGWRPDKDFLLKLKPDYHSGNINFNAEFIQKILEKMALCIRIESGEKVKIESLDKFNKRNSKSEANENKSQDDFASMSNYLKAESNEKNKNKLKDIDSFIKIFIEKVSFANTKIVFENTEKQFINSPEILKAWIELSKKREFESISLTTKIAKSTLSKTYQCQNIAFCTSNEIIENFQKITYLNRNNSENFVNNFNKIYKMSKLFDIELALILSNSFKSINKPSQTIFDDSDRYSLVFNSIMRYVNPKKGPKLLIAKHVNELLTSKGYL